MTQRGGGSGLVARPVFKTAMEAPQVSPVGSIPTRSRQRFPWVMALCLAVVPVAAAQEPAVEPPVISATSLDTLRPTTVVARDTLVFPKPPLRPLGAFFRSLAVPGWSQSVLDRRLTAGLFIAVEGIALGMVVKSSAELSYLRRRDDPKVPAKEQEREDWLAVLLFNHLFAGLEGFVGAHLWDFPRDVRIRAVPMPGGFGPAVTLPLPR